MPLPAAPSRRELLKLAAAVVGTQWLARGAWAQPRLPADPFTLGVASGSPTQDSVVLWTRLLAPAASEGLGAQPITVHWEVAHDEAFQRIVQSGQAQALPQLAHSVHVELQGLEPDRWYHYRFRVGDWVSTTGRTRTFAAPDAPAQRLRLAYASCQRWEHGHFGAWRHLRADAPDAVLFLGDYIYEYPGAANAVRAISGGWALDLAGYRNRYAQYKGDADLQAMHAACPWLFTWDDHEVQNDYAGLQPGDSGPEVADFPARRAAAYQAYYEHMPLRASVLTRALAGLAEGAELRLYTQLRFGRLASLYLLDARQYRDPQVCSAFGRRGSGVIDPQACAAWSDPRRTLLGAQQERWLEGALARAGEGWNVIGQQTLFGLRDEKPGPGQLLWNDGWDGYAAARTRLTDALQRHGVANAVFLGGDVHENWVGHVKADYNRPDSATLGVEFCGTSITSRSAPLAQQRVPQRLAENPHFVFADARRKGYGLADFTPQRLTTTLRVLDDVSRPDARIETLARFEVPAGRSLLEMA